MPLVTDQLKAEHVPYQILFHQPTFHARDEAHRLGLPLTIVVKTIALTTRSGYALAVIPAARRLDMHLVHAALGDPDARLATESEIAHRFAGYPLGALPPLSTALQIPIWIDPEVASHASVVFAVNQTESVRVPTEAVVCGATACIAPLVQRAPDGEVEPVAEEIELRASTEIEEELEPVDDPLLTV